MKRVGLSLDDFGTGYSSLTQLYQMPFNEMKIDKSLVMNVPHSREANTMVGSLIELGHNLGLTICAEGVENRAALDMLAIMGCDRCQGYFISRAVPGARHPELRDSMEPRQPGLVVHDACRARSSDEQLEHNVSDNHVNENRLMVMDDDPDVGAFFGQVGEDLGFESKVLADPTQFAATVLEFSPTVILLDLQMPGRDGIELLARALVARAPSEGADRERARQPRADHGSGARHVDGRGHRGLVLQADRARRARGVARRA